jgi:hypothetical protein
MQGVTRMSGFDIEGFVEKMDRLGMKLTVTPLADGRLSVNRWRMLHGVENAGKIRDLWTFHVGDNPARMEQLAAHLYKEAPNVSAHLGVARRREVK